MSELSEQLRRLSERGTERGADAVFAAARSETDGSGAPALRGPRRWRASSTTLTAIAAAVLLLAGVAGAIVIDTETSPDVRRPAFAAGTTTTTGPTTTTSQLPPAPTTPKVYLASTRLVPFNSCPTLAGYAKQRALDTVSAYGLPGTSPGGVATAGGMSGSARAGASPAASDSSGGTPPPAASPAASTPTFSGTNVQEQGIDEPDSVKTDGKTIFAVANDRVYSTSVGPNPSLLSAIDVKGAHDLLLIGSKLVVISFGGYYAYAPGAASSDVARSSMVANQPTPSKFSVYDVSNPSAMRFTGSFDVEGSYVSARLVDGVARIAVRSYPKLAFAYPADGSPQAQEAALAHNRDVVRATSPDTWLPHFTITKANGKTEKSKALSSCGDSYRPPTFSGFGMLSLITFDADDPASSHATSVMADGEIVYSSAERMYVASNGWAQVAANAVEYAPNTLVHAFDIRDETAAQYLASGRVRGNVLNQFALSEHNGLLRVATTDGTGGSQSFLTVLQNNGEALVEIGQVGGLGHGERIFGVRFIENAAYVVTFRQIDPLYVVDLTDPTKPTVKGELKATGYSSYLHPIGPGRLLGIGQDQAPDGSWGMQASVFDVADPSNPKLLSRNVIGGSYTTAQQDHHAFLYWAPTKLAVVPLSTWSGSEQFNGAIGMRVEDAAITEIGRMQPPNRPQYGPGIDRTMVIGDRLYAISSVGILVNTLDLQSTNWVAYPSANG